MSNSCGVSHGQDSLDRVNTGQGSSHQDSSDNKDSSGVGSTNGGSCSLEKLVNDWSYQKCILQHLVNKARNDFANSEKVNEFPQCNWFEEDDLLFEDTMTACLTNVDDAYIVGDIEKLRKTTSESITDLNEIVARLMNLTE